MKKNKKRLQKLLVFTFVAVLTVIPGVSAAAKQSPKLALLIIAHGAPFAQWNKPVMDLEQQVVELLGEDNPFGLIKVCMMEFTKPTIADGIRCAEESGCNRIIAVPLLIAPSSHSHWDIPALLGIYSDAEMEKQLRAEGADLARSSLPITVTSTLANSDVIPEIMLERVKALSKDAANEAVVLFSHGDGMTPPLWNSLMQRTITYLCGKTGISYADYGYVHVGQSYDNGVGVIAAAAAKRKRVIVVGSYLSMGVEAMHKRYMKTFSMKAKSMPGLENPLEGLDIVTASEGLLPDGRVAQWIAETAVKATSRCVN